MKGLIIKDFYCLRKSLKTFIVVTAGVIVIAIMFVLSSQHGNLAAVEAQLQMEDPGEAQLVEQISEKVVWLLLLIPIVFLGNLADCFKEDRKSGFRKTLSGLPLGPWKIVGSRYLTCLLFAAASMAVSTVAAFFIALAADIHEFGRLVILILFFGSVFLIYMSVNMFLIYVWGARRADLIQIIPLALLYLAAMVGFTLRSRNMTEEEMLQYIKQLGPGLEQLLKNGGFLLLLLTAGCMALSYAGSVAVVKCRKGGL